jgi:hypothetical protein
MKKAKRQKVEVDVVHLSREAIATLAYERFLERGCVHGHDVEDWLAAERSLLEEALGREVEAEIPRAAKPASFSSRVG